MSLKNRKSIKKYTETEVEKKNKSWGKSGDSDHKDGDGKDCKKNGKV